MPKGFLTICALTCVSLYTKYYRYMHHCMYLVHAHAHAWQCMHVDNSAVYII